MSPIISSLSTVRSSYGFGRKIIIPEIGGGGDPYFSSVSLLMYGDGANGSTTFTDSSSNNFTITPAGNAQISTAQSKFGGASMYFDGSGDYVTAPSDVSFDFGTGNFTIEFWMNPSNAAGTWQAIISRKYQNTGGWRLYKKESSTELAFYYPSANFSTSGAGLTNGTWHHIAVVKSGTTITIYVDGTSRGSGTSTLAMSPTSADVEIGQGVVTSAYPYQGYLDDLRITKGVARYTSNFTPPTASFSTLTPGEPYFYNTSLLLHGDGTNGSTTFVDSSSNNFTITPSGNAQISTTQSKFGGASMYFDGNGDYLSIPYDSTFDFPGDFTVEFWVRRAGDSVGGVSTIYEALVGSNSSGFPRWTVYLNRSTKNITWFGDDGTLRQTSGTTIADGTWYHIAWSRSGTTLKGFIDGLQVYSDTTSASYTTSTNGLLVGYDHNANRQFYGYIDDLRITKGVARYTANFTPPTAAFPDV